MDSTRQGPPVFAASEIEFLAEETLIRIVPLFDMDVLSFIGVSSFCLIVFFRSLLLFPSCRPLLRRG